MTIRDLCLYLARGKSDYPYGVPNDYLPGDSQQKAGFLFIYQAGKEAEDFLSALVEKGLKSSRDEHEFITFSDSCDLQECSKKAANNKIRAVVVFDAALADKLPVFNTAKLIAPPISEITKNPSVKKSFWKDLQAL